MPRKAEFHVPPAIDVAAGGLSLPRRPVATRHPTGAAWIPPSERKLSARPPNEMGVGHALATRPHGPTSAVWALLEAGQRCREALAWLRAL